LISRNYKGDVGLGEIEHFMGVLLQREEEGTLTPVLTYGHVHFLWIKHANLYRILPGPPPGAGGPPQVFSEYFKELEEESIRDNFVIIYELLDELMDFGFPQTTDSKILQDVRPRPQVSANGSVVLSEVVGTIKLKVFLSGMPELRLGLNDRVLFELTGRGKNKSVELEDVKFHQCVRLSRFDNDRTISFIPPDGDFELMSYRLHTQVKPLIWIESIIENPWYGPVCPLQAKGQFKKQSVANGVEIVVPVPSDADSPKFKTSVGSARYLPERNVVIWSIKSFP
ncbi:AP1M2 protein, partial [Thryothorus ludovicianus]|nr:AP1M2 protein [Thryothorus ludovicianus]